MLSWRWWIHDKDLWAVKLLNAIACGGARPDSEQGLRHISTLFWVKRLSQEQGPASSHSQRQPRAVAEAASPCGPADGRLGSRFLSHCWSC